MELCIHEALSTSRSWAVVTRLCLVRSLRGEVDDRCHCHRMVSPRVFPACGGTRLAVMLVVASLLLQDVVGEGGC